MPLENTLKSPGQAHLSLSESGGKEMHKQTERVVGMCKCLEFRVQVLGKDLEMNAGFGSGISWSHFPLYKDADVRLLRTH